jgi:hypothetical protein
MPPHTMPSPRDLDRMEKAKEKQIKPRKSLWRLAKSGAALVISSLIAGAVLDTNNPLAERESVAEYHDAQYQRDMILEGIGDLMRLQEQSPTEGLYRLPSTESRLEELEDQYAELQEGIEPLLKEYRTAFYQADQRVKTLKENPEIVSFKRWEYAYPHVIGLGGAALGFGIVFGSLYLIDRDLKRRGQQNRK